MVHCALDVLRDTNEPGSIEHFEEVWEGDERESRRRWQPEKPSPIIRFLRERAQQLAQERRELEQSS